MARVALKDQKGVRERRTANGTLYYEKRIMIDGIRRSVYGKDAKELKEKEADLRSRLASGITASDQSITLNGYFDRWTERRKAEVKKGNLKESTVVNVTLRYNKHIRKTIGQMKLKDVGRNNIESVLNKIESRNTYNQVLILVKQIMGAALKDMIIEINPTTGITQYNVQRSRSSADIHRALSLKEQEGFVEAVKDSYYYELFMFMLGTGCRSGEAVALVWSDIDWKNHQIHIQRTRTRGFDGMKTGTPKTENGDRVIPMTPFVESCLRQQRKKMNDLFGNVIGIDHRVFNTQSNTMILGSALTREIEYRLRKAHEKGIYINRFTPHALRATYATRAIEQGMSPKTLQAYLGHATYAITMDLYVGVTADTMQREMVDVFNVI